ncbi:MAG: LPS export ABC transporter periplasmic protein LptC [Phenylobacterium sp.]
MSAVSDMPLPQGPASGSGGGRSRRASIQRWRRRSRLIHVYRIVLPAAIAAILLGLGGSVAYNALTSQRLPPGDSNDPIRLVKPHFIGRDARGRPFVLTSLTATRDTNDYQKVYLDHPTLTLDADGADPTHIAGGAGIYHEDTSKLELSKGVRLSSARGAFDTATSLYDLKSGELGGSDAVQGMGSLGQIQAKSYGVYDKGERMVFTGDVHSRLQPK